MHFVGIRVFFRMKVYDKKYTIYMMKKYTINKMVHDKSMRCFYMDKNDEEGEYSMVKKKKKLLKSIVRMIGFVAVFSSVVNIAVQHYNELLPSRICVTSGKEETLSLGMPVTATITPKERADARMVINLNDPVTFVADEITSYTMELELLGMFSLKEVQLDVVKETYLMPVGIPIGIYLETDGVMVVDIGEVEGGQENASPAKYILQQGDYILSVNGEEIDSKDTLMEKVKNSGGESMVLTVNRDNQVFDVKVTPVKNAEDVYQIGVWVKDNAQGIGTLTYIDTNGSFGALGHGIHDNDTGEIVHLDAGSLYTTDIIAIKKGKSGSPGELSGIIDYKDEHILGDIYRNTEVGIFGSCNQTLLNALSDLPFLPVGYKQQVRTGAVQILTSIDGEPTYYDAEITAMHYDAKEANKGLEIQITDEALLEKTGGIVQGMSGSAIIQDGRIIGAVTHVLVADATRGYGIFIEDMLEN